MSTRPLILPLLLALLGITLGFLAARDGQRTVRTQDLRDLAAQRKLLHLQIETATDPAARAALEAKRPALEGSFANIPSYHRPGRQFTHWDGYRYEEIIDQGYLYHLPNDPADIKNGSVITRPGWTEGRLKNVAWYPLYPLLGYVVKTVTGLPTHHALTAVSWLCIVGGAVVFFLFARRHFEARQPALRADSAAFYSVALLLFGPAAIFLYANFTESLFVLLLAGFLYAVQGRKWYAAAAIAALASATRSQGVLFGPILALVYLLRSDEKNRALRLADAFVLGVISALGLAAYMTFLGVKFHDPLAFMAMQQHWHVGLGGKTFAYALNPLNGLANFFDYLLRPVPDYPHLWEAFCVIAPPVILLLGWRVLTLELRLLGWILWALPYVSNCLAASDAETNNLHWMSMGRFMAVVLPLHLVLGAAAARVRYLGPILLIVSAAAFTLLAFKFGTGVWVG